MALTTEQIHNAADAIAERGEKPTQVAVRRELGGGSFSTIGEAMASWWDSQKEEHALAEVEVPESVKDRADQMQAAVWSAAVEESERRLQSERDALHEAQQAADAKVREHQEAVAVLEADLEARETTIGELREAVADRNDLAESLRESENARIRAEQRAEDLDKTLTEHRAEARQEAERSREEIERLRGLLAEESQKRETAERNVAVSESQAASERDKAEDLKGQIKELKEELKQAQADVRTAQENEKTALEQAREAKGEASEYQRQFQLEHDAARDALRERDDLQEKLEVLNQERQKKKGE